MIPIKDVSTPDKWCFSKPTQFIRAYEKNIKGEKILAFMTHTYQSAVCVHSMMNTAMSILL